MSENIQAAPADKTTIQNPYKELDYYEEADMDRFAGRERDISQLLARIAAARTIVLYGRSGLGKTSLLLAGVFPRLRTLGYTPVYVRTLASPLNDLSTAIARDCKLAAETNQSNLRSLFREAERERVLVVALDQFEEFFIRFREQSRERAAFVRQMANVIKDTSSRARFLFSLREDYLAALDPFQAAMPDLFGNAYRLAPLSAFGARQAIVRPLVANGIRYDERLVTRLVDELAKFDFDSARLQIACAELYRTSASRNESEPVITETDLEHLGAELHESDGMLPRLQVPENIGASKGRRLLDGIFRRYLAEAVAPLAEKYPVVVRTVLDAMVTEEATKYALSVEELVKMVAASEDDLREVLNQLFKRKIVRRENRGEALWYELMHECLAPEILRWLASDKDFQAFRLARETIRKGAETTEWRSRPGLLLNEDVLRDVVGPFRDRLRLEPTEVEFVLRSAIHRCPEEVQFWAQKFGISETHLLLSYLLKDSGTEVRRGAAEAVGTLGSAGRQLAGICLDLALSEREKEPVRRAAGRSFAVIGGDAEIRQLRKQLRLWKSPGPVTDLLAELHKRGRVRGNFPWWWRQVARKKANSRADKEKENAEQIHQAGRFGALMGILAGISWPPTCGLVIAVLANWIIDPLPDMPWYFQLALYFGITIPFGLLLGAVFGRGVARLTVRFQIRNGRESWFWSASGSKLSGTALVLTVSILLAWFLVQILFVSNTDATIMLIVGSIAAAVVAVLAVVFLGILVPGAAQLSRQCFRPPATPVITLVWVAISGLAYWTVVFLAPGILLGSVLLRVKGGASQVIWFSVLIFLFSLSYLFNFVFFVATLTLARTPPALRGISEGDLSSRFSRRMIIATIAGALVPLFLCGYGVHATPLWRDSPRVTDNGWVLRGNFSIWPDIHYFHLQVPKRSPAVLHLELPENTRIHAGANGVSEIATADVFARNGGFSFALGNGNVASIYGKRGDPSKVTAKFITLTSDLSNPWEKSESIRYFLCKVTSESPVSAAPQKGSGTSVTSSVADGLKKAEARTVRFSGKIGGKWPAGLNADTVRLFLLQKQTFRGGLPEGSYIYERKDGIKLPDELLPQLVIGGESDAMFLVDASGTDWNAMSTASLVRPDKSNNWEVEFYLKLTTDEAGSTVLPKEADVLIGLAPASAADLRAEKNRAENLARRLKNEDGDDFGP